MNQMLRQSRREFLRIASLLGLGALSAPLLSSCAPAAPTAAPTKAAAPAAAAQPTQPPKAAVPAAKAPVTLQLHLRAGGENSEVPIYVTRPKEFMDANPNIKVELAPIPGGEYMAKVLTMTAAKTLGDVMWSSDVWTEHTRMVKSGMIAVVDDWLAANNHPKTEWLKACVETLTHDGKMYGLPKCSHPGDTYIWINEEMFQAAGIKVPEQFGNKPEDITEWSAKLAKGPENDRQVYGYLPATGHIMALYCPIRAFGGYENTEDGSKSLADTKEWWEWVQWTNNFFVKKESPLAAAIPTEGSDAMFAAGKLAMHHNQRFMNRRVKLAVEKAQKPFKWRVIELPRTAAAKGWTACVDTHSATTQSKNPQEAFALSYAMADPRFTFLVARDIGYLGGRNDDKDAVKDLIANDPFLAVQYECMTREEKFRQPKNARGMEVQTTLKNELDKVWLGQEKLTQDFMKRVKAAVDEILAKPF
jgi:ABC-type glycerol-3-phosphate transport system substrate-binding protein